MNTALKLSDVPPELEIVSQIIINGDLSKLTDIQKSIYLKTICNNHGLNPLMQPFAIMTFQGKQVLYAKKECATQLASLRNISVEVRAISTCADGIMQVETRATDVTGRFTDDMGCLSVKGLAGEALANAKMKCITKAKRRTVLAHCGLGILDESETETAEVFRPTVVKSNAQISSSQIADAAKKEPTRKKSETLAADIDASMVPPAALAIGATLEASALEPTELAYINEETGEVTSTPTAHTPTFDPTNTDHLALMGRALHELQTPDKWKALHTGKLKAYLLELKVPAIYAAIVSAVADRVPGALTTEFPQMPLAAEIFDANTLAHSLMLDEVFSNLNAPLAFVEKHRSNIEKTLADTQAPANFAAIKDVVLEFKAASKK